MLFILTISALNDTINIGFIVFPLIFLGFSLASLYYFLSIKILKLTANNLEITYLFLPISQQYELKDITSISQKSKKVSSNALSSSLKETYIYTDIITTIKLLGGKTIHLNSVGRLDFDIFYKTFKQLKRGEVNIKVQKKSFKKYLMDNYDGMFWVLISLFLTIGLSVGVLNK
ncbi:hypothetical protein VB776_00585 [Arcicella sp. DC2W]|uniref:PH domain-containing protein n=1 Tax=Arcicella gelida TaxID=2984195 RepID=A0ABU5RZ96_9BACT|nr:hypothetical protein [Arcicella sp. DC2W]MEA5401388.1 hypothetical protein [Arcicella sp. DC2W]